MSIDEYFDKGYTISDLLNKIGNLEKENKKLKERNTLLEAIYDDNKIN